MFNRALFYFDKYQFVRASAVYAIPPSPEITLAKQIKFAYNKPEYAYTKPNFPPTWHGRGTEKI